MRKNAIDMMNDAAEMLEASGLNVKLLIMNVILVWLFMKWERRMGNDPKDSVLNKWNQMHEVKRVCYRFLHAIYPF
jgi:hypothetical protein